MAKYKLRITDLPVEERPRERLVKYGAESLSNAELLAIILRTGTKEDNVINLCNQILKDYTLPQLLRAGVAELFLIKNTMLTKGRCTYDDFNRPPLKTEGGLDLGERLFPHRFDTVFKELTEEVLA